MGEGRPRHRARRLSIVDRAIRPPRETPTGPTARSSRPVANAASIAIRPLPISLHGEKQSIIEIIIVTRLGSA